MRILMRPSGFLPAFSARSTLIEENAGPFGTSVVEKERIKREDDIELVAALRRGDPQAPTAFYERARPAIDRTLRRLLGVHDADYDDMVQNSLIELVRAVHGFRGEGSLDGWVSTVTSRVVYKHIRERRAQRQVFDATVLDEVTFVPPFDDAASEVEARDILNRVRQHLEAIDEKKAWTYFLHDVLGYALEEIAQIMDVTVAAAQTRLVRGRRELEERLAADEELAAHLQAKRERRDG
jgi:RNA polymerase sigma-70 factor, ECF subfamily